MGRHPYDDTEDEDEEGSGGVDDEDSDDGDDFEPVWPPWFTSTTPKDRQDVIFSDGDRTTMRPVIVTTAGSSATMVTTLLSLLCPLVILASYS